MAILTELKRRHVFQVVLAYAIAGWVVVEAADVLLPGLGVPAWVGRVVSWAYVLGFVPVALLAWIFEWTAEGLKRDLGLSGPEPGENSIAVLPFLNLSDDEANAYFSDGISEELLNLLARIPELKVISRTSAFAFRDQKLELTEIAKRLNVAHILEGSVRKAGDRVRITAQLIKARGDYHLWSETWDRTLDDIFRIQDEIAARVVEKLKLDLLGTVPETREIDPDTYALYLQARHLARQNDEESLRKAVVLYKRALQLEERFPEAWGGLARTYNNQVSNGLLPSREGFRLAGEAARKAVEIDPGFASAWARLGWITMRMEGDFVTAAGHIQKALDLEPTHPIVVGIAGLLLKNLGRLEEAIPLNEYLVSRDPVYPVGHYNLALVYLYAGHLNKAMVSFERTRRLTSQHFGANFGLALTWLRMNEPRRALEAIENETVKLYRSQGRAMICHDLGDAAGSDAALAALIDGYGDERAYEIALVHAYRGDVDRAFEWLETAHQRHGNGAFAELLSDSFFSNLHDDARWLPFLAKIGRSPDQLAGLKLNFDPSRYRAETGAA